MAQPTRKQNKGLWSRLREWLTFSTPVSPQYHSTLSVEPLEDRTLLSVAATFNPALEQVQFNSTLGVSDDDLFLRTTNGILEHSTDGINFSRDLDSVQPGEQSLTLTNQSTILIDVTGDTTILDMDQAAGTFRSLDDLFIKDSVVISTRDIANGSSPENAPSQGHSRNISFQAPEIVIGANVSIFAQADNGFNPGDVQFVANEGFGNTIAANLPFAKFRSAETSIEVGFNSRIQAGNILFQSSATTANVALFDINQAALSDLIQNEFLANLTGPTEVTFDDNDNALDTISRSEGSWIADGFLAGQTIQVIGTLNNDGGYLITEVSDKTLTINESDVLSDENIETEPNPEFKIIEVMASLRAGAGAITFGEGDSSNPPTITRESGSWLNDGFARNQLIAIVGTDDNDDQYRVTEVTDTVLTLSLDDVLFEDSVQGDDIDIRQVFENFPGELLPLIRVDEQGQALQDDPGDIQNVQDLLDQGEILLDGGIREVLVRAEDGADLFKTTMGSAGDVLGKLAGAIQGLAAFADSEIILRSGVRLNATGNVTIASEAISEATISSPGFAIPLVTQIGLPVAIGVGISDARAHSIVENGVDIQAGVFNLTSDVTNTLDVRLKSVSGLQSFAGPDKIQGVIPNPIAFIPNKITALGSGAIGHQIPSKIRIPAPGITLTYGRGRSESEAHLQKGANVHAANVFVTSDVTNHFDVSSAAQVNFPEKNLGEALTVAISDTDSDSKALVSGNIGDVGDLNQQANVDQLQVESVHVEARSVNKSNTINSKAAVKDKVPGGGLFEKIEGKVKTAATIIQFQNAQRADPAQFGLAAAIALGFGSNEAIAAVDDNAIVNSKGDLSILAYQEDNIKSTAIGGAKAQQEFGFGGALSLAQFEDDAKAFIGKNARVNLGGSLTIQADSIIPDQIKFVDAVQDIIEFVQELQFDPPAPDLDRFFDVAGAKAQQDPLALNYLNPAPYFSDTIAFGADQLAAYVAPLSFVISLLGPDLGVQANVPTTYTNANASAKVKTADPSTGQTNSSGTFAFAGSVNIFLLDNESMAYIDEGAQINVGADLFATADQSVSVEATSRIDTVNIAGMASTAIFFKDVIAGTGSSGAESKGVVGGNFTGAIYDNSSKAYLADGVIVKTVKDVSVKASAKGISVGLAQAGAQASAFGFSGAVTLYLLDNEAEAYIEETANVDAGGDLEVDADTRIIGVNLSFSSITTAGGVGIGTAVAVNEFSNTAHAYIGNNTDSTAFTAPGTIRAKNVTVDADHFEVLVSASLAGAIATGGTQPKPSFKPAQVSNFPQASFERARNIAFGTDITIGGQRAGSGAGNTGGNTTGQAQGASDLTNNINGSATQNAPVGVGISGDVSLNIVLDDVQAYIADGVTIVAAEDVVVEAQNKSFQVGTTAAYAISAGVRTLADAIKKDKIQAPSKGAAIAGSFALNALTRTTKAFTSDVTLTADDVTIQAESTDRHLSSTGGGAGASVEKAKNAGVAGTANFHFVINATQATLGNGTNLTASGDLIIQGENVVNVGSVAGAIGVGGAAGVGAGLDLVVIVNLLDASIGENAIVNVDGNIEIEADNQEVILSLAGTIGAGAQKLGIAGLGSAHLVVSQAEAYIGQGANVQANGSILIEADDFTQIIALAASVAGGKTVAIGGTISTANIVRLTSAFIDDNAIVSAKANGIPPADGSHGIVIDAEARDILVELSASGGVTPDGQAAVSVSANAGFIASFVEAYIGENAKINLDNGNANSLQSVSVSADHDTILVGAAGSVGLAINGVGVGAATDLRGVGKEVHAYIDNDAEVQAQNNVIVEAETTDRFLGLVGGISVGSQGTGAGTLGVLTINTDTKAFIDDRAKVTAEGNVVVSALSDAQILPVAGSLAVGLSSGVAVGASNATVIKTDTTEAYIGKDAEVSANGNRDTIDVHTGERPFAFFDPDTKAIRGVSVTATSFEDIVTVAAGAAGTGGQAGVAGSVALNVLVETTRAYIDEGAKINQTDGAGEEQSVNLSASDETLLVGLGGALAVGTGGGAGGAGVDLAVLTKITEAEIEDSAIVHARDSVMAQADSDQIIVSASLAASIGAQAGIAGALGIGTVILETRAVIDNQAQVDADGNVVLDADSDTYIVQLGGGVGGSQQVGVGATIEGLILVESTEAYIDSGAIVNARGLRDAVDVRNGNFDVDFFGATTLLEELGAVPQINNSDIVDPSISGIRRSTAETEAIRGLAVSATTQNDIHTIALGGGFSTGATGVAIVGSLTVATVTTEAYIADNAKINQDNSGAGSEQSVLVAAGSDYSNVSILGVAAASQNASVGPALDFNVLVMDTDAYLGHSTIVNAAKDITVNANAIEDGFSLTAGVTAAVGTGAAVAGTMSVLFLHGDTTAYIGDNARVTANGNLLLQAQDRTDADILSGQASLGLTASSVGVGGSFAVTPIVKETEAYIGQGAQVTAKGNSNSTLAVVEGNWNDDGPKTEEIKGLGVQALSKENLFTVAVSGAISGYVNVAGALSATLVRSTTSAYVSENVILNGDNDGASSEQTVNVSATNDVDILTVDGSTSIAAQSVGVGISGSIDLGLVLNETTAYIGNGSTVDVEQDLDIHSLAKWDIVSFIISGSLGVGEVAVGVGGAASLYAIGVGYNADARDSMTAQNGTGSAPEDLDNQLAINGSAPVKDQNGNVSSQPTGTAVIFDTLDNYATETTDANGNTTQLREGEEIQNASQRLRAGLPQNVVSSQISTDVPNGTSAFIGSQVAVRAGRHITVDAKEELQAIQVAGGAGIGAGLFSGGAGGGVVVTLVGSNVQAYIDGSSTIEAGLRDATGDITIQANFDEEIHGSAFAFGGGLFFGLGAQAVVIVDVSHQQAYIGAGTEILSGDQVSVHANADQSLNAAALGGAVGAAAIGLSVANITTVGDTMAYVAEQAEVGNGIGQTVNHLDIRATSETAGNALAAALAGGGTGVAGALAFVTDEHTTAASIDANAIVKADGNVVVDAISDDEFTLLSGQVAIGGTGGVGAANSNLVHLDTTKAYIDTGATVTANGNQGTARIDTGAKANGNDINGYTFTDDVLTDFPPGRNDDNRLTETIQGLSVGATSYEEVTIVALGAASGGSAPGFAGSLTLTVLTEDTQAYIAHGAVINEDNSKANQNHSVRVKASDRTRFIGAGGCFSGGGQAGVGAGLDVSVIDKSTEAYLGRVNGPTSDPVVVSAGRNVIVEAISEQDIVSAAAAASLDGVGLAGALGAQTLLITTRAFIGDKAVVTSEGNIVVSADNDDDLLILDVNLTANAIAGVGASIAATVVVEQTEAFIGRDALVTAKGNRPSIQARLGKFKSSSGGAHQGAIGEVLDENGNNDTSDSSLDQLRKSSASKGSIQGLAVTATSQYDAIRAALAGAASTNAATLGASLTVATVVTTAHINENAKINQDNTGAGADQSILVAAGTDYSSIGITGSVGFGGVSGQGGAALSPALDINVLDLTTEAYVAEDASLDALEDIIITADTSEDILTVAIGLALSGGTSFALSLAGSLSVVSMNNRTSAYLGRRTNVTANGNILVSASDETDADIITGAGALSAATISGAIGGSLSVTPIRKTTEAYIDQSVNVTADGNSSSTLLVLANGNPSNGFNAKAAQGIGVQASSSEDIFTANVSGSVGSVVGLAGAVVVNVVDSDTSAFIAENARVQTGKSVSIGASNEVDLETYVGSAGGALIGGFAGGVDVGLVRNDTSARIGNGSTVTAGRDIDVLALASIEATSVVISAAAGAIGLGGAASAYAISGNLDSSAEDSISSQDGGNETTGAYANGQARGTGALDILGNYTGDDDGSREVLKIRDRIDQKLAGRANEAGNAIAATVVPSGTSAFIGSNATIQLNGNLQLAAKDHLDLDQTAGGAALGLASFGGSVVIGLVDNSTDAHIGNGTEVTAGGPAFFSPDGKITIEAEFTEDLEGAAFAGAAGGLVGLAAQGVFFDDNSKQTAYLDHNAEIIRAADLQVIAKADRQVGTGNPFDNKDTQAVTASLGLGLSVGVAIADVEVNGSTIAELKDRVEVGQQDRVRNVSIVADSKVDANANTIAVAGGVGIAGAVNQASATIDPQVEAKIGSDAKLTLSSFSGQGLEIKALSQADADVSTNGIVVGTVAVGKNDASAEISPDVNAILGDRAQVRGNGSISIISAHNYDVVNDQIIDGRAQATSGPSGSDEDADGVQDFAGGIITFLGADANARSRADVTSAIGEGASIDTTGTLDLKARSSNHADARGDGIQVGLLAGFGQITATARSDGDTEAIIRSSASRPTTVNLSSLFRSLTIEAKGESRAEAEAEAAGGGLFSGVGAQSDADVNTDVEATIGDSAVVATKGRLDILAESKELAQARSEGVNVGGITISNSDSDAKVFSDVEASVGQNASVDAALDLTIQALHNPIGNNADAFSRGSVKNGGSIVGISDTTAEAVTDVDAIAQVGQGAALSSNNNIGISAISTADVSSDATNRHRSAIAIGNTKGLAGVNNDPRALIGSNATITAGKDFTLFASSVVTGEAEADEIGESVFNDAQSNAFMVSYHSPLSQVGTNASIVAGETLRVDSVSSTNTDSRANVNADSLFLNDPDARAYTIIGKGFRRDGFNPLPFGSRFSRPQSLTEKDDFSSNEVHALAAPTKSEIDQGAQLKGRRVEITARVTQLDARAEADSEGDGVFGQPDAFAEIAALSTVNVDINDNANIVGLEKVDLRAEYASGAIRTEADAFAKDDSFPAGSPSSRAHMAQFTTARVGSAVGSTIQSPVLRVEAITPNVVEITRAERDGYNPPGPVGELGSQERDRRNEARDLIDFNSTVTLPGLAAILEIDSAGNAVRQEGITFTDDGTTIRVDDVTGDDAIGNVIFNIVVPTGTNDSFTTTSGLTGSPVFNFEDQRDLVEISNASNRNLEINDISLEVTGIPQLQFEGRLTDDNFRQNFNPTINSVSGNGNSFIDIQQTGLGDIFLNGFIDSPEGTTSILNTGGIGFFGNHDILSTSSDALILSHRVNLEAQKGAIGTLQNRVDVELVRGEFWIGGLTASARDDVILQLNDRLRPGSSNGGALNFNNLDIIGRDINLDVLSGAGGSIYFSNFVAQDDLIITAQDSSFNATSDLLGNGSINIDTDGSITLNEIDGDLRAGAIRSRSANLRLSATKGSIVDALNDPQSDVTGNGIILTASNGIGTAGNALEIDSSSLLALAQEDINIIEVAGNLNLNEVRSSLGNVTLTASNGSIRDNNSLVQIIAGDVKGKEVTLTSLTGGIGTNGDAIEIQSTRLTAQANNNINLAEVSGNLNVHQVISDNGSVKLVALQNGSILDANNDASLNILGSTVDLESVSRSIGTAANAVEIQSDRLLAKAEENIHVTELNGDLNATQVIANNGNIELSVTQGNAELVEVRSDQGSTTVQAQGSILDRSNGQPAVVAMAIDLTSETGSIGEQNKPLEIDSDRLRSQAMNDVHIREVNGDLNVDQVISNQGNVRLTAEAIVDDNDDQLTNIKGERIDLTATAGSIGSPNNALEIEGDSLLAQAESMHIVDRTGDLLIENAVASNGDITIQVENGNAQVQSIQSLQGNTILGAFDSILDERNDDAVNISAQRIDLNATTGGIGTFDNPLEIDSTVLTARAEQSIFLTEVAGDLNIEEVTSTSGDVELRAPNGNANVQRINALKGTASLFAEGSILDDNNDDLSNLNAEKAILEANNGSIGTEANRFEVQVDAIDATAKQDIFLTDLTGDLTVEQLTSEESNVNLIVSNGSARVQKIEALEGDVTVQAFDSILDSNGDLLSNIDARIIDLTASNGSIGNPANALDIESTTLRSLSFGDTSLREVTGDLQVESVISILGDIDLTVPEGAALLDLVQGAQGNVSIVAKDAIVDSRDDNAVNIRAFSLDLTSQEDAIGSESNPLDVATTRLAAMADRSVTIISEGDVTLTEIISTTGDIEIRLQNGSATVDHAQALQGDIVVAAPGSVTEEESDATADLEANNILLLAQQGSIGAPDNDLEINTAATVFGTLTATAGRSIFLTETHGFLLIDQVIAISEDVRLSVEDSLATNEDLLLAGGTISAAGSVDLRGGDNVLLLGSVIAGGPLTILVDFNNADPGVGGRLDILNPLVVPTITITGNTDSDLFVLHFANGTPIPADGITIFGDQPTTVPGDILAVNGNGASLQIVLDGAIGQGNGTAGINGRLITFFSLEGFTAFGPSIFTIVTASFRVPFLVEGPVALASDFTNLPEQGELPQLPNIDSLPPADPESSEAILTDVLNGIDREQFLEGGRVADLLEELPEWLMELLEWIENLTDVVPAIPEIPQDGQPTELGAPEGEESSAPMIMPEKSEELPIEPSRPMSEQEACDRFFEDYEGLSHSDEWLPTEDREADLASMAMAVAAGWAMQSHTTPGSIDRRKRKCF